jgi:hypothetical protein
LFALLGSSLWMVLPSLRMALVRVSVCSVPSARRPALGLAPLFSRLSSLPQAFSLPYSLAPFGSVSQLSNGTMEALRLPLLCACLLASSACRQVPCGPGLFFDRWRARPGWHLTSAGRCFPVSDLFRFLPLVRRRISRVPWVSLLVRTPSSQTPPGPAHLAFTGAWVSSPLTPVTRSRPKFEDTMV